MMLAYCGIDCAKCPVYVATRLDDDNLRQQTAQQWSQSLGQELKSDELVCWGCKSKTVFKLCTTCDIKECNTKQSLENCSQCDNFMCSTLENFLINLPAEKEQLKALYKERREEEEHNAI